MPRPVRNCARGRGIQYDAAFVLITKVTAYWIARLRGQ